MKSALICPDETLSVRALSRTLPPAAVQVLGKPLIVYWIEHLVALGAKEIQVFAADRPHKIRNIVHDGYPWGIKIDVIAQRSQPTIDEVRQTSPTNRENWLETPYDIVVVHSLPSNPTKNLFESFEAYFNGVREWMPHAQGNRVNLRQISPGVWVSARSSISDKATLKPPCWIEANVRVEDGAVIGPMAVLESNSVVGRDAIVINSVVEANTYIGELTNLEDSIACGNILINWKTNSVVAVPDSFLICNLAEREESPHSVALISRLVALIVALATCPFILPSLLRSLFSGTSVYTKSIAVRLIEPVSVSYYQLRYAKGYLARWPQLWNIVRGEFSWFGNRPLSPREASEISPEFERLWLELPPGLFSQADAAGCWNNDSEEAIGHACFYSAKRNPKSKWEIFKGVVANWRAASRETQNDEGAPAKRKVFSLRRAVSDFLSL
jgi:hypothetical protein